ncbi:ATP-binding protein [Pseudomonas umsongensis]|uniref:ATP-binding protein n=1 Tax=Pseudomonas umsongensis TaxID=198618 RepID=UPI00200A82CF|nr:SbcC/MukB-like Walker B domain-containing protein [Pseudomonas umsongensis]MCK8682601.1 hypothetical protein [Pseudomonas umsongensis]
MSKRAHARRFLVANWKGIRFHCFDLDRHLTGLQGRNGAGKTTIMAAYVTAMLPNQRLLDFPNLAGKSQAKSSDAGLWGRLGDGVCYSLIEWITPRASAFWAGVTLTRAGTPHIDIKYFTIEGLPEEIRPHQAFLEGEGAALTLPTYTQLRSRVTVFGARLTQHRTLADYMRALYEAGITPLPMSTQEEQARYYRLLSSSMSGSSLAELGKSGLRNFLLVEDPGLEKRVTNMRGCLVECRQTRHELDHAQSAHTEISELYDAVWAMIGFAYFGAIGRHEQAHLAWKRQVEELREKRERETQLRQKLERLTHEGVEIALLLELGQDELKGRATNFEDAKRAVKLKAELDQLSGDEANSKIYYDTCMAAMDRARVVEHLAHQANGAAMREQVRIARELGDLNLALEESTRRVIQLRMARDLLRDARLAVDDPSLQPGDIAALKLDIEGRYRGLNTTYSQIQARLHAFDDHVANFTSLFEILSRVAAKNHETVSPDSAHAFGVKLDQRLREQRACASQSDILAQELVRTGDLAVQQKITRREAKSLGVVSQHALEQAIEDAANIIEARLHEQHAVERRRSELEEELAAVRGRLPGIQERVRQFRSGSEKRVRLVELGVRADQLNQLPILDNFVRSSRSEFEGLQVERVVLEGKSRQLKAQVLGLQNQSGVMDARIGSVAEQLEGMLFASRFDELSLDEARLIEARLGGWTEAIVVPSPMIAAQQAVDLADRPDTILLLSESSAELQRDSKALGDSELIDESHAGIAGFRLTRRPLRPILGRRSREIEVLRLQGECDGLQARLREMATETLRLQSVLSTAVELLALGEGAWAEDQAERLLSEQGKERTLAEQIAGLRKASGSLTATIGDMQDRRGSLLRLETTKTLLELPDYQEKTVQIGKLLDEAKSSGAWVSEFETDVLNVLAELPILANAPQASQRETLVAEVSRLADAREYLNGQLCAVASLEVVLPFFQYEADESVYETQSSIVVSLQQALKEAEARVLQTQTDTDEARGVTTVRQNELNSSFDGLSVIRADINRCKSDLTETGFQGLAIELDQARRQLEAAQSVVDQLQKRGAQNSESTGACRQALEGAKEGREAAENEVNERLTAWRTERRARRELLRAVRAAGLEDKLDTESNRERFFSTGNHIQAFQSSRVSAQAVLDRLKVHTEVHGEVELLILESDRQEERRTLQVLKVWERVLRHIEQRIPRNIATSDDPQVALAQMSDKMKELQRTLNAQEAQMRMQSVGIAGAIGSRLQTSKRLVRNLNHELTSVAFGSIQGVRIHVEDIDSMKIVLTTLEASGNGVLFDTEVSLEDALAQIYRQSGRGTIAGMQLLDYRNYLNLRVEVQRITGQWEAAGDSLSTGEAIGVGTAILIMVLRTWNDEARRINGKGAGLSAQQVLLDEATRLDPEALDTFTEFCQRMDVQALVAAPSLERPRRATVFILERVIENEREQVVIRGQRLIS